MSAISDFRDAVLRRELPGMLAALAEDVVLHSPVSFSPFRGRQEVGALLGIVLETFEDFRYTDELEGPGLHGLLFRARIGTREAEGIDLLRPGPDGLVIDFTVMVRPASALMALGAAVGPQLERIRRQAP